MLGALCALLPALALAQPDTNNAPKAENPPNRPVGGNNRGQRLTPEQRAQREAQRNAQRAQMMRQMLVRAGLTDEAQQNFVVTFAKEQETAREALQEKWRAITQALRGQTVTETQLASLLNDFRALVDEEKTRREKAMVTLETQVELSKKPRLDALLMVMGLTGDEASFVNGGANAGGRGGGFGGRGGFGGFGDQGGGPGAGF